MKNIIDFTNFTKKIFASTLLTSMLATLLISATFSSALAEGNTVTLTPVADTTYGSGPISITATLDPAKGNVTFTWSGSCNLTGTGETQSISITGAGTCTVTATKNSNAFAAVTFNIAKKDITMSTGDFASPSKIYDGTTVASTILNPTAITFSGVINGDDSDATKLSVNTSTGSATLSSRDATTTAVNNVTFTGYTLQGTKSGNYNLTNQPLPETQIVNKRTITVTPAATTKVYDTNTSSVTSPVISPAVATGDTGAFTQSYVTTDVATAKEMIATGNVSDSNDGNNYTVTFATASVGVITKKGLTVTGLTASNKEYDSNTSTTGAGVPALVGVMATDTVTLGGSAVMSFLDSAVANGKTVNVTGLTISGTSSDNYSLTQPTLTANITAKNITISGLSVANKVYDGLTIAIMSGVATLVGVINTDLLNVRLGGNPILANFDTKNASTTKLVNITGYTASGTAATNYNIVTPTTTADITKKTLTVTVSAANKVYDGNTDAVVTFSDNRLTGDLITITGTANFSSKTVANTKLVTVTGLTVTGTDAVNYVLATTVATTTANITKKDITANVTASSKTYDANTLASSTVHSSDVASGDFVDYTFTSSNFSNKNVGIAKLVTVNGIALGTATDTLNYNLLNAVATTNANITARDLIVSSVGVNKAYDGTTTTTVNSLTSNYLLGDVIGDISSTTSNFIDKNVGVNKLVTTNILIGAGVDNTNYNLPLISTTTANITKRTLNMLSASGTDKEYDGSRYGFASITDNRITGDVLVYASTTSLFDTKNAGDTKSITVSGITVSDTDATNYTLASTSITTPLNVKITKKSAIISAENKTKAFGDADPILTATTSMLVGDTLTGTLTRTVGENVGTYTINQGTLSAGDNYITTFNAGVFTITEAIILPPVIVENFAGSLISSTNLSSNATRRNSDGTLQVLGTSKFRFTKNLKLGMKNNNDVKELQKVLNSLGLYASTSTNGNFDNELFKAVKAYQKINKVTPVSGYFGPITRGVINK